MPDRRIPGIAATVFGLMLLTGGILIMIFVPAWGHWIATYPERLATMQLPAQAQMIVGGFSTMLGPLLTQIGDCYMKAAGYFIGSLMTIIALAITAVGVMLTSGKLGK